MKDYFWFVKSQWAALAFGFLAVFWGNFGQTFFVGLFSAPIQESLGLTAASYGWTYSIATLASALTVVWAGGLIDHVSLRKYTAALCCGLAFAALVMWQTAHIVVLALGFYCLRLFGQALLPHTGSTTMARTFETHRGKALSIATSGVPAGEIVLPLVAVLLIGTIGWQNTYLAVAVFTVLLALPLMLSLIRYAGIEKPEHTAKSGGRSAKSMAARAALLSDSRYWLALPGLMAGPFIVTGIFIHQDFVITSKGWSPTWFAACFVVYGVVHWLSSLVAGSLVDRFRAVNLLPFFLLPMALGLLILAFLSGAWVALVLMALLAMTIGGAPPISGSLWPEIYGVHNLGAIRSLNIALMVFATSLSPTVYGYCIDRGIGVEWIFGWSAAYVMGASLLFSFSYTARPEKHKIADEAAR